MDRLTPGLIQDQLQFETRPVFEEMWYVCINFILRTTIVKMFLVLKLGQLRNFWTLLKEH